METLELITVSAAARLLAASESTVRRLCNEGKLRCWRASGLRILRRVDVEQLAAARAAQQPASRPT